jgi:hypothetical protein
MLRTARATRMPRKRAAHRRIRARAAHRFVPAVVAGATGRPASCGIGVAESVFDGGSEVPGSDGCGCDLPFGRRLASAHLK